MGKILYFAQKGLILDKTKKKLLVVKYDDAKYTPQVKGKYGFPGGKLDFDEDNLDLSFVREVREETGITIKPGIPFFVYSWKYTRDEDLVRIVAVARLGEYKTGELAVEQKEEKETKLNLPEWLDINRIIVEDFVADEHLALKKFLEIYKTL
jgi:8-oxo-dGTP pyrophosphatase MutT (NUDIX family)